MELHRSDFYYYESLMMITCQFVKTGFKFVQNCPVLAEVHKWHNSQKSRWTTPFPISILRKPIVSSFYLYPLFIAQRIRKIIRPIYIRQKSHKTLFRSTPSPCSPFQMAVVKAFYHSNQLWRKIKLA